MAIYHLPGWSEGISATGNFRAIPNIDKRPSKCKRFTKEEIEKYQEELLKKQQVFDKSANISIEMSRKVKEVKND